MNLCVSGIATVLGGKEGEKSFSLWSSLLTPAARLVQLGSWLAPLSPTPARCHGAGHGAGLPGPTQLTCEKGVGSRNAPAKPSEDEGAGLSAGLRVNSGEHGNPAEVAAGGPDRARSDGDRARSDEDSVKSDGHHARSDKDRARSDDARARSEQSCARSEQER